MRHVVLDALTLEDCERVRLWRNAAPTGLRTPYPLTAAMQEDFYRQVVSSPESRHRYFAVREVYGPDADLWLVGMAGLTNIEWEGAGSAEVSLVLDPTKIGKGYGSAALRMLLVEAFVKRPFLTVYGEVYECNPALGFWQRETERYGGEAVWLPRRKWWDGQLWRSLYFVISVEQWRAWLSLQHTPTAVTT